jgi:glycosyltransferase involved in cell wall biosynthesis
MAVICQPIAPYLLKHPVQASRTMLKRYLSRNDPEYPSDNGLLDHYDLASGEALMVLCDHLQIDALYAFHNTSVARLLQGWPHPARLLAINMVGFGIDPSRGGAKDNFFLQELIFQRPVWDLHITATKFEYDQYHRIYGKLHIDADSLLHLPHCYDEELFQPRESERPKNRQKRLLYPVNLYPRKNAELAIEVLGLLREQMDVTLTITGQIWDKDYHSRLVERARKLTVSDRIEFLGGVSLEKLAALYRQVDLTISTSHQETFGLGLIESLGCGTPVVGPNWIAPCREILEESVGGYAVSKEPDAIAARIREVLDSNLDPKKIASAARQNFGNHTIARRFLAALLSIRKDKERKEEALAGIDWKALYRDAGDLL